MRKRPFIPVQGVSNIELFYDLIFVYCISVITSLCHHVEGDFLSMDVWVTYMFSFAVVLQVWFFTTFLLNRYGDRSVSDNVCLFINMFLLYFLASGIQVDWRNSAFTFNLSWGLILFNLLVHWLIKRFLYNNLDKDDKSIMTGAAIVLGIQCVIVLIAAFLPEGPNAIASWVGLLFGGAIFVQVRTYRRKHSNFGHLVERCSLLVIVAFGETIVAISAYMTTTTTLLFPVLVFALVVGLFLIYIYERDNMTDHNKTTDGMGYLTITGWVIMVIGNLTVALEFMPDDEIAFIPKSAYLTICLVLYLLTSFVLGLFNKPEFKYSVPYIAGRLAACAAIVIVAITTSFNPLINLVFDTITVYASLWHEWFLYRSRSCFVAFGHTLGMTYEELKGQELTPAMRDDLRSFARSRRNNQSADESEADGGADEASEVAEAPLDEAKVKAPTPQEASSPMHPSNEQAAE